jgi:hypothetical protein
MDASAQGAGAAGGQEGTREMPPVGATAAGPSPAEAQAAAGDPFAERPELYVGAAFAGGLILAKILKRVGR